MQAIGLDATRATIQAGAFAPADKNVRLRVYGENYDQLHTLGDADQGADVAPERDRQAADVRTDRWSRTSTSPSTTPRPTTPACCPATPGARPRRSSPGSPSATSSSSRRCSTRSSGASRRSARTSRTSATCRSTPRTVVTCRSRASPRSASGRDPLDIQHQGLSRYVDVSAPVYRRHRCGRAVGDAAASSRRSASRWATTPRSSAAPRRTRPRT